MQRLMATFQRPHRPPLGVIRLETMVFKGMLVDRLGRHRIHRKDNRPLIRTCRCAQDCRWPSRKRALYCRTRLAVTSNMQKGRSLTAMLFA
jgi:hypothetical protein